MLGILGWDTTPGLVIDNAPSEFRLPPATVDAEAAYVSTSTGMPCWSTGFRGTALAAEPPWRTSGDGTSWLTPVAASSVCCSRLIGSPGTAVGVAVGIAAAWISPRVSAPDYATPLTWPGSPAGPTWVCRSTAT